MNPTSSSPGITLVAAMAQDRVIGRAGGIPWHLPADLAHFRTVTLGHAVIMGRRTFESIGRPLPGRKNIVISRQPPASEQEVTWVASLEEALAAAGSQRVMVIGGGQIYRLALPLADCLELTFIDAEVEGDTHFPAWTEQDWLLEAMSVRPADADNPHALVFARFRRA